MKLSQPFAGYFPIRSKKDYLKKWRLNNLEKAREYGRKWKRNNKEIIKAEYERNKDEYILRAKKWKNNNPEKIKKIHKISWQKYYLKNKENLLNKKRKYSKEERKKMRKERLEYLKSPEFKKRIREYNSIPEIKERRRELKLKKRFNLSLADYNKLLDKQKGVCAICYNTCSTGRRLAVDHNHKTDKIRGLLCGRCNQSIGRMEENISLLESAILYLKQNA